MKAIDAVLVFLLYFKWFG